MASSTALITSEACAATIGAPMSFTPSIYSNVMPKHSFKEVFIITKIFIDRWSIYGCKSLVRKNLHSDAIVIMGIIVPVITIRTYVHALHHLPHLAHLLSYLLLHRLLELLEFGSSRSLPITNNVVKGIVTVSLIGHNQDKAYSDTN